MGRVFNEAFFDIKKHPGVSLLILVQISILIFSANFFFEVIGNTINQTKEQNAEIGELRHYALTDNLVGDYEKEFLKREDALINLKKFNAALENKDEYGYVEAYQSPLLIFDEKMPETTLLGYDDNNPERSIGKVNGEVACEVKGFAVTKGFMRLNPVRNSAGEIIPDSMYDEENGNVNIILGHEYEGIYSIGDEIRAMNMGEKIVSLRVVDFLEEGASVYYRNKYLNLDRYVLTVFPSDKEIPEDYEEYHSQIVRLIMKMNGEFVTKENPDDIQAFVNEACKEAHIYPASKVESSTNAQIAITGTAIDVIIKTFEKMLVILAVFSVASTIIFASIKISRNKKYYGVLLLNGYSKKEIFAIIMVSFGIVIACANALGLFVYKLSALFTTIDSINVPATIVANLVVFLSAMVSTFFIIKETQIDKFLRGIND